MTFSCPRLLTPGPGKSPHQPSLTSLSSSTNCGAAKRRQLVQSLLARLPVHSYGPCLNNRPFPHPDSRYAENWAESKKQLLASYKFTLAFENTQSRDYVTEKAFHALAAGSIPVYW